MFGGRGSRAEAAGAANRGQARVREAGDLQELFVLALVLLFSDIALFLLD